MEFWGEKSCLVVPLIFKDEVTGCLKLVEKRHLAASRTKKSSLP